VADSSAVIRPASSRGRADEGGIWGKRADRRAPSVSDGGAVTAGGPGSASS
jgi:hypothetical protein